MEDAEVEGEQGEDEEVEPDPEPEGGFRHDLSPFEIGRGTAWRDPRHDDVSCGLAELVRSRATGGWRPVLTTARTRGRPGGLLPTASGRIIEQAAQGVEVGRLDEVGVEARPRGRAGGPPPGRSRSGRRGRSAAARGRRGRRGPPRSRPCPGQADVAAARRRGGSRAPPPGRRRRRGRPRTSCPSSCSSMAQALGRVDVVVDDQDAARGGRSRGRPASAVRRAPRGAAAPASGRRTVNSLPRPGPSLWASTVPPCSSTRLLTSVRPRPRPPSAAVERAVGLGEQARRRAASISGAMPMPLSRDADDDLAALAAGREPDRGRPAVGVLGGVVQQVGDHLRQPRRVGRRASTGSAGSVDVELGAGAPR